MKKIFVLLALTVFTLAANASSYQVEIIIFEHLQRDSDGEIAQIGLKLPDFTNSINPDATDTGNDNTFKLLPAGLYKLGGVYNELKFSRNYRPLLHMAWQQPALNQFHARNVRIRKIENDGQTDTAEPMIKIDGIIRIRSAQFLHADVDLFYFVDPLSESFIQAGSSGALSGTVQVEFSELKETRKMIE